MNEKSSCPVLRGRDGGDTILLLDGKTQIALEYAYRNKDDYQVILWVKAETEGSINADFVTIASLLNLPEKQEQEQHLIIEAVKRWFKNNVGWLLVLDNADDLEMVRGFI